VSNIPAAMPQDRVKDRLEMSFSKPSRGGGEVEKVDYNENTGTGCITFLHPGGKNYCHLCPNLCVFSCDFCPLAPLGLVLKHKVQSHSQDDRMISIMDSHLSSESVKKTCFSSQISSCW